MTPPPGRRTIIYVGHFELPDRNAAAQRVLATARIFREIGYKVVIFGVSRDLPPSARPRRVDHEGVSFECWEFPYPVSKFDWLRRIAGIGPIKGVIERNYAGDLAAMICYDYPAVAQARLAAYFRARGAVAVADVGEWYSATRMRSVASVVKNIDRPLRMRWVNAHMDGIIAASHFLGDYYRATGVPVVELPSLVEGDLVTGPVFPATPDGEPKRLLFAGTGFVPALVAQNVEGLKDRLDKVIAALLAARRLGADFVLEIYGVDRDNYLAIVPAHRSIVEELGDRLVFNGFKPRALVRDRLARADYSIFLRKKNRVTLAGWPTKFGESVHFGTPVITNAVGTLVSYHVEGRTGHYIDYDDSDLAGRQLAAILGGPAAEVAAMKAFCRSSGMFHYKSHVEPIRDFIERITA